MQPGGDSWYERPHEQLFGLRPGRITATARWSCTMTAQWTAQMPRELPDLLRHAIIVDCVAVLGGCCVIEDVPDFAVAS